MVRGEEALAREATGAWLGMPREMVCVEKS